MRGVVAIALVVSSGAACQDSAVSRTLGAECTTDRDCDDLCASGGDWPDGMCTLRCTSDTDCPTEAACIPEMGGICAFRCTADAPCAFLGPAYACKAEQQVMVCRGS